MRLDRKAGLIFLVILFSLISGIGMYLFFYAKGYSYLGSTPEACKNCHVMNSVYNSWSKGGHQDWATCNDCHVPHNPIKKYAVKALNGLHHSYAFTKGNFPPKFKATEFSKSIIYANCRRCHQDLFHERRGLNFSKLVENCSFCHKEVGHEH